MENKVMFYNTSSVRIYIDYPTQFSMQGKFKKGDVEYIASLLHYDIPFDWSGIEFKYQYEHLFFHQ